MSRDPDNQIKVPDEEAAARQVACAILGHVWRYADVGRKGGRSRYWLACPRCRIVIPEEYENFGRLPQPWYEGANVASLHGTLSFGEWQGWGESKTGLRPNVTEEAEA